MNAVSGKGIFRSGMNEDGQLTMVGCIVMSVVILAVAEYAMVRIDIEAADPGREPLLGPEFEVAKETFIGAFREIYSGSNVSVNEAFNDSFTMVTTAEARYGFAFSAEIINITEISPDEYEVSLSLSFSANYGYVSSMENVVLKR